MLCRSTPVPQAAIDHGPILTLSSPSLGKTLTEMDPHTGNILQQQSRVRSAMVLAREENSMSPLRTTILVLLAIVSENSWADHRSHSHFGFYVGIPWVFPPPYYYYPPRVVVLPPAPPPVYIEQAPAAAPAPSYWYYCEASRAYYPYVKDCPGGWMAVAPTPPR